MDPEQYFFRLFLRDYVLQRLADHYLNAIEFAVFRGLFSRSDDSDSDDPDGRIGRLRPRIQSREEAADSVGLGLEELSITEKPHFSHFAQQARQHLYNKRIESCLSICEHGLAKKPMDPMLHFLRASARLFQYDLQGALADIDTSIRNQTKIEYNDVYLKVSILCCLERFEDAVEFATNQEVCKQEDKETVKKLLERITSQLNGQYNMLEFLNRNVISHNDCANFKGPVEVRSMEATGRGLVATQELKMGQLISASKAFAFITTKEEHAVDYNKLANIRKKNQEKVASIVELRLERQPELKDTLFDLYGGPESSTAKKQPMSDQEKIKKIIEFNAFGCRNLEDSNHCGLWLLPSYINHSCGESNALWMLCGDFLFIRALRDIKEGEEILISYTPIHNTFGHRWNTLATYGFECKCSLCRQDQAESKTVKTNRKKILRRFRELEREPIKEEQVSLLKSIIKKLEALRQGPNLHLVAPKLLLANYYFSIKDTRNGIELMTELHELVRYTPQAHMAAGMAASIVNGLIERRDRTRAQDWIEILKSDLKLAYGSVELIEFVDPDLRKLIETKKLIY